MAVDNDEFELPVCVEEKVVLLSKKVGVEKRSIASMMCRKQAHRILGLRFVRVEVEDGDDE